MAEKRMFAKTIIDSDLFLDMPITARLLYYDLAMRADDDGFVNSPKKIMRMVGASPDDLSVLIMKSFILPFDTGIIVIKHWRIHNYIRKDTYHETLFSKEKAQLELDEDSAYKFRDEVPAVDEPSTGRGRVVDGSSTQNRIDKSRLDKNRIEESTKRPLKRFHAPTVEEVKAYCEERKNGIDPQAFVDHYESNGWKVGKNPMKDWKAAVRTWERNGYSKPKDGTLPPSERDDSLDDIF